MPDTIIAPATPAYPAAIAVLRISGPQAREILDALFVPRGKIRPRRMTFGRFIAHGRTIDEGLAVFMPGPGTYTGEDSAELYCHGSPGVAAALAGAGCEAGARYARAGEFTRRAFLAGKLDLTQAEAVIDLIDSETEAQAANAVAQLEGALGKPLGALHSRLVDIISGLCAIVDYPDEDVPEPYMPEVAEKLDSISKELTRLADTYNRWAVLRRGVRVAIVGRPNVGKSSLLNAAAGFGRAIVTSTPGTTRDVIEQQVTVDGVRLALLDTAGIRKSDSEAERMGIDLARETMRGADAVIAVFDGSASLTQEDGVLIDMLPGGASAVVNKCDLPQVADIGALKNRFENVYLLSAKTGERADDPFKDIARRFQGADKDAQCLVTNPRQEQSLRRAAEAAARGADAARHLTADVVCTDAQEADAALGELTGLTAGLDIVDEIFSRFCVGK